MITPCVAATTGHRRRLSLLGSVPKLLFYFPAILCLARGQNLLLPAILQTSISCDKIRFNATFSGLIYTEKGTPNCIYADGAVQPRSFYVLKIPLTGCETRHNDEGNYENEIVVQAGRTFQAGQGDKRFLLTCIPAQPKRNCSSFFLQMERVLQCVHTAISQHSERIRAPEVTLDSAPRPKNARSNLEHQIWYHGAITRAEAERRIKREGDFLIRESNTQSGHVILTGSDRICTQHVLIQIEGNKCVYSREQQFESVVDLVQYHYNQMLPVRTDQSEMRLLRAIPRPEKL